MIRKKDDNAITMSAYKYFHQRYLIPDLIMQSSGTEQFLAIAAMIEHFWQMVARPKFQPADFLSAWPQCDRCCARPANLSLTKLQNGIRVP